MSILIWILIGFLVYSFIVAPVLMELALDKPKKTENGKLRIKKNGLIIRVFYGVNVGREKKEKCFPKNTCQLYKGIYGGIPLFFLFYLFVPLLFAFFVALVNGVAGPFSIIAGHMPNPGFWLLKNNTELFYPYERIGSKKWIAPWKFILPIGLVALVYFFYREIFTGLVKVSHPLSSKTAVIAYGSIASLVFLVIVINKIRKIESFVAGKETVISLFKKMCKEIEIKE